MTTSYNLAPGASSEDIALRRKLAAQLLQQGTDVSPVQHWTQGLARALQGGMGGYEIGQAKREEDTEKDAGRKMFADYLDRQAGGQPAMPTAPTPSPSGFVPPAPDMPAPRVADAFGAFPDAQQSPGGAPAPAMPRMASASDPAAIRFNNPGGQYPGPSANAFGSTGTAIIGGGHKIAQFPDPVSGAAAQFHLLGRAYAGLPLAQAIAKWSGGNNAGQYTASVSRATGLAPDTVITPELLQSPQGIALVRAMAKHETGREFPMQPEQWQQAQTMAFSGQPQGAPAGPPQTMPQQAPQQRPMGSSAAQPAISPQQAAELKSLLGNKFTAPMAQQTITGLMQRQFKEPKVQVVGDQLVSIGADNTVKPLYDATKKTDDERNLAAENKSRADRGQAPLSITQFKAANSAATAQGTQQGEATAMLPAAESRANRALQGVDEIRNHPGRLHGFSSNAAGLLQGTPQYDFKRRVDQLKGGAFLEAFQMLKGGGAVTEAEGNKASIAMERMDRALSKEDFDKALDDYQAAVRDGFAKLQLKARGETNMAPQGGQQQQAQTAPQESRTIGTKNYVKINGQWFEQ